MFCVGPGRLPDVLTFDQEGSPHRKVTGRELHALFGLSRASHALAFSDDDPTFAGMYNPVHMSFMTIARRDVKVCPWSLS